MPRRSASASAVLSMVQHPVSRIEPPADMDPSSRRIFEHIVASSDHRHFVEQDAELLRAYCEASAQAAEARRHLRKHGMVQDGRISPWVEVRESAARSMVKLSVRLRLGPHARIQPVSAARRAQALPPSTLAITEPG